MRYVTHSDDWHYQPPVPPSCYRGWWIENDDGEPMDGPYDTKEIATEVMNEEE